MDNLDDLISRETMKEAIDSTTWYHQNRNKDMIEGASDAETAWYKAEDVYKAIDNVLAAQPERKKGKWKKWWEIKPDGFGGEVHIPHWACAECGTEYSPHLTSSVRYCVKCGVELEDEE